MSAAYRFLPWVRRGAAARVTTPDDLSTTGTRATVAVAVTFNADPSLVATTALELTGPGDVLQLDGRAVSRTWPPAHALDAEPNYFPAIEFDQVDLPWRYTPRAEDAMGRLRPWLCLLVFTENELGPFVPSGAARPLDSVTILSGAPMPPPTQTWAWGHVQVSGDDDVPLPLVVTEQPERCLARLLCPRRLVARTTYWALLVPVFEVGRRSGLRLPLGESSASLAPAWTATTLTSPLEMPIYYRWRFTTGEGGDFESLARRLTPRVLPGDVGTRPIEVNQPGGGLPSAAAGLMRLGGALRAPGSGPTTGPSAAFRAALTALLNRPADVESQGGAPVGAPPLYGGWHAKRARLEPAESPLWLRELNDDPRARIAAALGTEVVQDAQQALMASAWAQVEGIREANAQLRMAQLARAVGERLHRRHVQAASVEDALVLTARVHGHVRVSSTTVRRRVDESPPQFALFSGAMRRLVRPRGPVGRRQSRPDRPSAPVLALVNDGPYGSVLAATPPALDKRVPTRSWLAATTGAALPGEKGLKEAPPRQRGLVWDPIDGKPPREWPVGGDSKTDSPSMAAFRSAAAALAERPNVLGAGGTLRRLDLVALKKAVETATEPRAALAAAFAARSARAPGFVWNPADPIEPVMAHPVFPQPMYRPLAELSPDWMLPGLCSVPADSVSLAETNPAFIEAYMVGLNVPVHRLTTRDGAGAPRSDA